MLKKGKTDLIAITQVKTVTQIKRQTIFLTCSLDGSILFWDMESQDKSLWFGHFWFKEINNYNRTNCVCF